MGVVAKERTVLVVDDATENLDSLCELLSVWGYDAVQGVPDGKQALALALESSPDIIVTDLGLADGEAFDLIRRVKAASPDVFVIAFSGWHKLEAAARAAGADAFVLKPDLEALERALAQPARQRRPDVGKRPA